MITVTFRAKIEKLHEYTRFRGMIVLCGKEDRFKPKELVYANEDTEWHVYAKFNVPNRLRQNFIDYMNEMAKIYTVEKYVTIKEEEN